jgi:rubredoxin
MENQNQERDYVCIVCGHTMKESDWQSLPEEVGCPECGVGKHDYYPVDFD